MPPLGTATPDPGEKKSVNLVFTYDQCHLLSTNRGLQPLLHITLQFTKNCKGPTALPLVLLDATGSQAALPWVCPPCWASFHHPRLSGFLFSLISCSLFDFSSE
jgi:hypothetical protein